MKIISKTAPVTLIACLTLLLSSCNYFKHPVQKPAPKPVGIFEGVLPIAWIGGPQRPGGCSGIKTELTIYDNYTPDSYIYALKETYLYTARPDSVTERRGHYNFERGTGVDENAVVYVLDDDSPPLSMHRRFWKLNDSTMLTADTTGTFIDSTVNFVLKKKG